MAAAPSIASPLWDGGGAFVHGCGLVYRQPPLPKGGGPPSGGGGILWGGSAAVLDCIGLYGAEPGGQAHGFYRQSVFALCQLR